MTWWDAALIFLVIWVALIILLIAFGAFTGRRGKEYDRMAKDHLKHEIKTPNELRRERGLREDPPPPSKI